MPVRRQDAFVSTIDQDIRTVTLYGSAAITAGNSVVIDTADTTYGAGYSVKQAAGSDDPLAIGIALETTTAAGNLSIQVGGYYAGGTDSGSAITVGYMVGSAASGKLKALGAPSASVWPFALAVKAYSIGGTDGIILICDRGFYKHG